MSRTILRILAVAFIAADSIGTFIPGAPVWLVWLGEVAAPILLFCMAWSMDKEKEPKKYLLYLYLCSAGMAVLNLIFSIPAAFPGVSTAVTTNLFATLFASAYLIWLYEYQRQHPGKRRKVWLIYGAWQLGGAALWCVLSEIVGVPTNILQFVFTICGNMFLAEGSALLVGLGLIFYLTKENKKVLRFAYCMLFFIYFLNASTGIFGRVLSLLGSDVILVVTELMTGLSMYGTWATASFSFDHLMFHDYQWMMIAALPVLYFCNETAERPRRGKRQNYWILAFYPAAAYVLWFFGNYIV
ncbi:MAG: hypothetical protein IJ036_03945 [Lachnospiraceae bacterium]|nr:hypothetical protein [Lachnospiraceae bacterium]